jgi:hypothetical protein
MNGLWTAEFGSNTGMIGSGVVVFRDGAIFGGDKTYYYVGTYRLDGRTIIATLKVSPFIEGAVSVFRTTGQEITIELVGSLTDDGRIIAQGNPVGMPDRTFAMKLTKRV